MRALVVHAHPHGASFSAALRDEAVAALRRAGHVVDVIDLHAEGFDPRLSAHESATHRVGIAERPELRRHAELLGAASILVLVHPTWWGGPPAILKGWFDRVWCEGVAYTLPDGAERVRPLLRNVRRLVVVTTCGSPRWINRLQGEPGRITVRRGLRTLLHPLARTTWLALHDMDRNDEHDRRAFLRRVGRRLEGIRP